MKRKRKPKGPLVTSVEVAGRDYLGLSRTSSYRAVKSGLIPVIRFGPRNMKVSIPALEKRLAQADPPSK